MDQMDDDSSGGVPDYMYTRQRPEALHPYQFFGSKDKDDKYIIERHATRYMKECRTLGKRAFDQRTRKFHIFGFTGVKGMGKSEALKQVCRRWAKKALGDNAKAIYTSFENGGAARGFYPDPDLEGEALRDSFGHKLLIEGGVDATMAMGFPIKMALTLIRESSPLVICIDDVFDYFNPKALVVELMELQDTYEGKIILIFTCISGKKFRDMFKGRGRQVKMVRLELIGMQDVFQCMIPMSSENLKEEELYREPGVNQFILACSGNARITTKTLPDVTSNWNWNNDRLPPMISKRRIENARKRVCEDLGFDLDDINQRLIRKWFSSFHLDVDQRLILEEKGLIYTMQAAPHSGEDELDFLSPILLHCWAECNQYMWSGKHLYELYNADAGEDMERVLIHYEALLRKSLEGKTVQLREYYNLEDDDKISEKYRHVTVEIKATTGCNQVQTVEDFKDVDEVLEKLQQGFIVALEKDTAYLVAHDSLNSTKLVITCVQCKFNVSDTKKLKRVVRKLREREDILCIPVIFTSKKYRNFEMDRFGEGMYFCEDDILRFTRRLGILRFHVERLGAELRDQYPSLSPYPPDPEEEVEVPDDPAETRPTPPLSACTIL
jgi:hypothetical protein